MSTTTREMKISRLNDILPMVRETLRDEKELESLRQKSNKTRMAINYMKNELGDKRIVEAGAGAILTKEDVDEAYDELEEIKAKIKEKERKIGAAKEMYKGLAKMISYGMMNCYHSGGLLNVAELNEEYLYEYAYLIQNTTLTVYQLLSLNPKVRNRLDNFYKRNGELKSRKQIREFLNLAIRFDKE